MAIKKRKKEKKVDVKKIKSDKKIKDKTMLPTIWNPYDFFENFNRFFLEDPWSSMWWRRGIPLINWPERWLDRDTKIPTLDLIDTGDKYKIVAEVPGVLKENIDINITEKSINICGETITETEEENEGYLRRERGYSTICRDMQFPEEVNPDKAEATLKNGILEVKVSKKKSTKIKGRKISVK